MIISESGWSNFNRLSEFPREFIPGCFVYAFYDNYPERGGQVVYVGSTASIRNRMASHYSGEKFCDPLVRYKKFVPGYHLSTEYRLINKIKPVFNSQHIRFKNIEEKREWVRRGHTYRKGSRWADKRAARINSIEGGNLEFAHG